MRLIDRLLTLSTPKDNTPEAVLSGDIDELLQGTAPDFLPGPGEAPSVEVEDITEDD